MESILLPQPDSILSEIKRIYGAFIEGSTVALFFTSSYAFEKFYNLDVTKELLSYLKYPLLFQQYTIENKGVYFIKTFITPRDVFEHIRDLRGKPFFVFGASSSEDLQRFGFQTLHCERPDFTFYSLNEDSEFISVSPKTVDELQTLVHVTNASKDAVIYTNGGLVGGISHHGEFVTDKRPPTTISSSYFIPTLDAKVTIFVENGEIKSYSGDKTLAKKMFNRLSGNKVMVVNIRETVKHDNSTIVSNYDRFTF